MIISRLSLLHSVAFASLIVGGCNEEIAPPDSNVTGAAVATTTGPAIALSGRVVDQADVLNDAAEKALTGKLEQLEREAGPQFVIVTTSSLNGLDIEKYSLDLGNSWGIGHVDRNDGVILLVAPNERKVRIQVGYGLEKILTNPFCAKVVEENIVPALKEGNIEQAIIAGADRLIEKMRMSPTITLNGNEPPTPIEEKLAS